MNQTGYVPCALLLAFDYIIYVCVCVCVCVRARMTTRFHKQHCHGGLGNGNALFDRN
jgi:hypothetical protein